jgi:hypothetical protein
MKSYCIIEMSNINEGIVNDITLKYFTNKEFASKTHKHLETKTPNVKSKDKKFYRKRMMALTKYLLYDTVNEETDINLDNLPSDIPNLFSSYLKKGIEYFKTQDRVDILQEEYTGVTYKDIDCENKVENVNTTQQDDIDSKFLKSVRVQQSSTLDNFVHRTVVKKEKTEYPRKKNVNLTDPVLKNKGLGKKKNIDTKYEEGSKDKTEKKKKSKKQKGNQETEVQPQSK